MYGKGQGRKYERILLQGKGLRITIMNTKATTKEKKIRSVITNKQIKETFEFLKITQSNNIQCSPCFCAY